MSRRCPRCKTVYAGEARFCPKDGSPLVDVAGSGGRSIVGGGSSRPADEAKTLVRQAFKTPAGVGQSRAGSLSDEIIDRRYQIQRKLGEGGMAFVYEARDLTTGESVAIKVLSPKLGRDESSIERLRREAGLAMRLDHPNACRILRLGETEDGLIYLVMPYLRGELLSDREVAVGPMDAMKGVEILVQCCAGLHHAHDLNIVHRDLKPENIMLVRNADGGETAVVMDFGLAKERRASPGMAKLTATGIILGTPEFMSPEQIRGKALDRRSDIYALGIVGYEMFSSQLPFQGRTPQEMMVARLRGKPVPLRAVRRDFPKELQTVLMRSMETEPDQRYATAWEFGQALIAALDPEQAGTVAPFLR
jgi:serine/threonine-protein kinase